tara:strand:+ start:312 stop:509 length:198 start_codon:yes stop_codon:yes gene_type:complete
MKVGDLIKFKGTWGSSVTPGERRTGVVMEVWTNGRTRKQQSADILWDNGDFSQGSVHLMEVINED